MKEEQILNCLKKKLYWMKKQYIHMHHQGVRQDVRQEVWGVTERFYVSDKALEQSEIKEKIDKLYESTEE